MAFELTITFTGLWLFLRDEKDGVVRVVAAEGHHQGMGEPHLCCAFYDKAFVTGAGALTGEYEKLRLPPLDLKLTGYAPKGAAAPPLPPEVARVPEWSGDATRKFQKRLHEPNPHASGKSRINLRLLLTGGSLHECAPATWKDGAGKTMELTNQVRWTLPKVLEATFDWRAKPFPAEAGASPAPLHPVGGKIALHLFNVPAGEMPPNPASGGTSGDRARHFAAYYSYLEPEVYGQEPVLVEGPSQSGCFQHPAQLAATKRAEVAALLAGAVPVNCLTGGGEWP